MKFFYIISILILFTAPVIFSQENEKDKEREREGEDTMKVETEEVVITGTRTLKKIIDIPYSVFRVDPKEMAYGRDMNAKDILQDVPGLFLQTRFGSDVRISIRGFGTRSNSGVRGIRILQDGIPESDPDGETSIDAIDFTSLGGVEVVKGNQSSLYTNSPGGVINFLSDVSFPTNFVKITNQGGEFNLRQNGIKVGIHTKNYRFFTSYSYRNIRGFRQHSGEFGHLVNSYYQAYLGNKTSVTILGNFTKAFVRLPGGLTRVEFDQNSGQADPQAISSDLKRITSKGRLGVRINNIFGKNNSNEIEFTGFGKVVDMEYTDYVNYNKKYKYVLGSTLRYVNKMPVFKHENEFTTGIDYFYVTGPLSQYTNLNGNKGDELQTQRIETQGNIGAYFQDQFNIMKQKLYFLFSGRYDKVIFETTDELNGLKSSGRQFDRFTPKAALNYKLSPTVAVYTSFGFGFDTPSATEMENFPYSSNNGLTTINPDIRPQKSRNFEVGIKGDLVNNKREFMKKAFFEFTLFNTRIDDEIIPFTISDQSYYRNAAQTNRTGLECGIKLVPFEETDLIINYTYTHFRYNNYISRTYNSVGNPVDVNYTGNKVPAVPQHLTNFILEKELELTKHITGLLVFDCDYVSKMFVDDQNTENTGDYFYANTLIGANFIFDKFNILFSAGVNNFLNRKYVGFININANPEFSIYNRRYFEPGEPRNFYVNLNMGYRF
jgi:iron complex outermembrane receptor protein